MTTTESQESKADMAGQKLSRDERKQLRKADLFKCGISYLIEARVKADGIIAHLEATHARQLANGMPVTAKTLEKNCASHRLTVECIDEILKEADANLQRIAFDGDCC